MSHRGRRVQASASWEADCAVPCSWTRSSETRDGWINTMRQTACSHFLPLPRWNATALRAQGRHHRCWLQHSQRTSSTSELSFLLLTPKRCLDLSCYGRKTSPALVHYTRALGPSAKKIQIRTEYKRARSARHMKQYQHCHVAVTHTFPSASRAPVDAAMDGAFTKSMGRQNRICGCSTAEKDLEYLR